MSNTEPSTPVQVVPITDLTVREYRGLKTAALTTTQGAVLAQIDTQAGESPEHLQFRLLKEALNHRQDGAPALGVWHRGIVTTAASGALQDHALPNFPQPGEALEMVRGQLTLNGEPLSACPRTREQLQAGATT